MNKLTGFFLFSALCFAQSPSASTGPNLPHEPCGAKAVFNLVNADNSKTSYQCVSGHWATISGPSQIPPVYTWPFANWADDGKTVTAPSGRNVAIGTTLPAGFQNLAWWGDSLTAGTGGLDPVMQLAPLVNLTTYNGGVGGDTSTQIKTRMLAATDKVGYVTVLWAGRNNFSSPATVKADIAAMVSALSTPKRFLVLSILASTGDDAGSLASIAQLNADLSAIYPSNYLDVCGASPTLSCASGVAGAGNRSDTLHLNTTGYGIVAQQVSIWLTANSLGGVVRFGDIAKWAAAPSPFGRLAVGTFNYGFGWGSPQSHINGGALTAGQVDWREWVSSDTTIQTPAGAGVGIKFQHGSANPTDSKKWAGVAATSTTGIYSATVDLDGYAFDGTNDVRVFRMSPNLKTSVFDYPLVAPAGGPVGVWTKYSLVKTAGAWVVNGGTPLTVTDTANQDVTPFTAPLNAIFEGASVKTSTACSGTTTATLSVGTNTGGWTFLTAAYDIKAAVATSNHQETAITKRSTSGTDGVLFHVAATGANVSAIADGCAVDVWLKWSVLP